MGVHTTISLAIRVTFKTASETWAYVEAATTAGYLMPGMNGVMFDNAGSPPTPANPPWSNTQTELGSTTYLSADTAMFQALHTLLTATYGSNPRWWDGLNTGGGANANRSIYVDELDALGRGQPDGK